MTQDLPESRRKYVLDYLERKDKTKGSWIRITDAEFYAFGGKEFFEGCGLERCNITFRTKPGDHGWLKIKTVTLAWTIYPPADGWKPSTTHEENGNDVKTHHIDRTKLIELVTANKDAYALLRESATDNYRILLEAKSEAHVRGEISSDEIKVKDDLGQITMPPDETVKFDEQLQELELDVRKVIELDDNEYHDFVKASTTNLQILAAVSKRLEALR